MSYASCIRVFSEATLQGGIQLIQTTVKKANLRRHSDFISRVFLIGTPHFAPFVEELAHACVSKTNCLNVWGGCASGILCEDKVYGHEPALLIAVFGEAFEPPIKENQPGTMIELHLAENDQSLSELLDCATVEPDQPNFKANALGLLSYGANYTRIPRLEHGRICNEALCSTQLQVLDPLILNSEGLTFLTEPLTVTESNGLFLFKVENMPAQAALKCPDEQTKPVGLRLQVLHENGECWIPVMAIHAEGALHLVAPVLKGQKVRLAKRSSGAIDEDLKQWAPVIQTHFKNTAPQIGILMAGFERSQMCHSEENDIKQVVQALPDTELIGIFGQACWLSMNKQILTPPRNNRLSLCLFNKIGQHV